MALPAATVWEVRPATGSDNNGGAFVAGGAGTDWSQQASPQYALTGIASSGSGNTVLSAAAATDMVDNIAQVLSGTNFNAGFFRVLSVVAGVSITFGTNNASQSICSGVGASGVINIGGALATIAAAAAALVDSNTVWIKGTYTVTSTLTLSGNIENSLAGGATSFIGYASSRGDGLRATWTTATDSIALVTLFGGAAGYRFQNIHFSSTAGSPGKGISNTGGSSSPGAILFDNCELEGFTVAIWGDWNTSWSINGLVVYRCNIHGCSSHGIWNDASSFVLASYIHDNGGDGLFIDNQSSSAGSGAILVWRCVIKSNAGNGIRNLKASELNGGLRATVLLVIESDILNNGADNVNLHNSIPSGLVLLNSIIDGAAGYGVNLQEAYYLLQLVGAVAWRANATADVSNVGKSPTDVTLTGDPFTSRSTDDFSLNSTAGAGQACKAIGEPKTFPP